MTSSSRVSILESWSDRCQSYHNGATQRIPVTINHTIYYHWAQSSVYTDDYGKRAGSFLHACQLDPQALSGTLSASSERNAYRLSTSAQVCCHSLMHHHPSSASLNLLVDPEACENFPQQGTCPSGTNCLSVTECDCGDSYYFTNSSGAYVCEVCRS